MNEIEELPFNLKIHLEDWVVKNDAALNRIQKRLDRLFTLAINTERRLIMLKKLEPIVFLLILTLCTLLGCSKPKKRNGGTPSKNTTPSLISLTKPLIYSKNQAITYLVINNTGDPVVRCTVDPDLPNGLEIAADSGSCRITGTPTVTLVQTTFTITGTDAQGQTDTATVSIVVNDETPSKDRSPSLVSIADPLVYFKDQAITPLVINNTGDPVVDCTLNSDLPDGLEIAADNGNCRITGTPTVALAETEFTITGTDAEGETSTATVSIAVKTPPPSLVDIADLLVYFKDEAITPLVINNTGDPVVDCTLDSDLPDGLEIAADNGNCRITGTPTVALAETEFMITGTDAEGETDVVSIVIMISPIVIQDTGHPSLADIRGSQVYFKGHAITPLVINNTGDLVVRCTIRPDLPNGLKIVARKGNCQITGIPTVAAVLTHFTVTGTDLQGHTGDASILGIAVVELTSPLLTKLTGPLAYFKGHAITPLVINNTGDPVVRCTIRPDLPNGLEIAVDNGNCRITGTPTVTLAETAFTITGADAEGETDTAMLSIGIYEKRPPSLANITKPQVYFKGQVIITLVIKNTGDPVVRCTARPNLPNGLEIVAKKGNCQITGTSTVTLAETEFTITGADKEGEGDTATVSIVIGDPALSNLRTSILSPTFPLATASDTTIIIQTNQDSRISIHRGLNCNERKIVSKNVVDIASNVEIILPATGLKKDNRNTDFSNFFTLCQEDKEQSNAVAKITSFMAHSLSVHKSLDAGVYQIGDIWSKVFVRERSEVNIDRFVSSYSHLVQRLFGRYTTQSFTITKINSVPFPEYFKRLGRSTAFAELIPRKIVDPIIVGTAFYIGENTYRGKTYYIMATNHHNVCGYSPACDYNLDIANAPVHFTRSATYFPLYEYMFSSEAFVIGTWADIDFALYAFEFPNTYSEEKRKSTEANLSSSRLEFDFISDVYPGQELVTAGYGQNLNPKNSRSPAINFPNLMFSFDKDCKVFSPRNDFLSKRAEDPRDSSKNYNVFSFAHGCDSSHGDSGGAVMDRKTGKIVGVIWSGAANTGSNTKNSDYIHTHYMDKREAFDNLPLAVPAPKIKIHLEGWVVKNDAALNRIQKRLLRKFLDKELK